MTWFRKKASGLRSPRPDLRAMLLCELSLTQLADLPNFDPDTPMSRFHAARASVLVGDRATARRHLHELLDLATATTQIQLLAWNCLRELDELPSPAAAITVRGVAVDFGTAHGLDTLAAYEDRRAQIILGTGAVLGTGSPSGGVDDAIMQLLAAGRRVVEHTHPHRGPPEHAPDADHTCIRVLTFAGTHVGLGPTATLQADAVGGPVLQAATALRTSLLEQDEHAAG
jgi:hypothetical protein